MKRDGDNGEGGGAWVRNRERRIGVEDESKKWERRGENEVREKNEKAEDKKEDYWGREEMVKFWEKGKKRMK